MVLLCKCGSADVVEPKLTGGRAPVPELMESAAPPEDDGEEVKVEKKKRKSLVKRAYEGAKQCRRIGAYVGSGAYVGIAFDGLRRCLRPMTYAPTQAPSAGAPRNLRRSSSGLTP